MMRQFPPAPLGDWERDAEPENTKTYAVLFVDRHEDGAVFAYSFASEPDLSYKQAKLEANSLRNRGHRLVEIYPTVKGFNVWNADVR